MGGRRTSAIGWKTTIHSRESINATAARFFDTAVNLRFHLGRDRTHELVLQQEDIVKLAVVALGPQMTIFPRVDQLRRQAQT